MMSEKQAINAVSVGDSEPAENYGNDRFNFDLSSIMNSSQISNASNESTSSFSRANITHSISVKSCRFPKLEDCAHFHYERVQLGKISVRLIDEKLESGNISSNASQISDTVSQTKSYLGNNAWFIVRVIAGRSEPFLIRRSVDNLKMLDELVHTCVYDRKISGLENLKNLDPTDSQLENIIIKYLNRFSMIASDALTCGPVLTWLQLDNKGRRLPVADTDTMKSINTPAVGAAYGVRRYHAQACDEISIEVGDMISVIDMPSPAESVWWRGKKSHLQKSQYEVGFFPQNCVATIGDKVPRHMPLPPPLVGSLAVSPTKPVLRKHGKLIAFFRSFILSRPSRRRLKQSGIYKERVFSCDLSEHILNSGQEIPMVLKCCAEFIEEYGIVDGIYRLSGITSNIQKLRRAFDEERIPDLTHPEIKQDIHAVSSLLKMYFRELPNPLCTYQLYDNFVDVIQNRAEGEEFRLKQMKETVQKLPPPHYRTLKYLSTHLNKISRYSDSTGMTDRNLAIVWAPNLLRSPALESGGVAALRGVGVQAVVTEYLITNCESIFADDEFTRFPDVQLDSLTDSDSFVDQRDHEQSLLAMERPKSLNVGGAKLLSIEEAQSRHNRSDSIDINKPMQPSALQGGYIEVGGGPSSLPDKYHTVLPVPRSWQKRKTHSWKSLFSRTPRQSNSNHDMKGANIPIVTNKVSPSFEANVKSQIQHHVPCGNRALEEEDRKVTNVFTTSSSTGKVSKLCSMDIFDGKSITTLDACVRSNSIDSLRTAGHSRSVSHDSYFDLLQSPLRAITMDNSREMSELGLNFDREEPEMRIFSETESLVSSPKIIKDRAEESINASHISQQNQVTHQQLQQQNGNRRIMRARPEEFSSAANSVNPSPKKQPRLNSQNLTTDTTNWLSNGNHESSCKRYKLEDQLSDIQYIDCSTPEHTINNNPINSNTIYTSVQVHNPPASSDSSSHEISNQQPSNPNENKKPLISRNSYPANNTSSSELYSKGDATKEGRFSYPGVSDGRSKLEMTYFDELPPTHSMHRTTSGNKNALRGGGQPGVHMANKNRYSFFEQTTTSSGILPNETKNNVIVLRSNSAEMFNTNPLSSKSSNSMNRSKLSIATPQSPIQSPRYSLLVGDTSSDASSSLNTPTYDNNSRNSFDHVQQQNNTKDNIEKYKLNMSLDLNNYNNNLNNNNNKLNNKSTPNTPNHVTHTTSDNTSQSITPSEFGYHNLNRIQSNVVSLEGSPTKSSVSNDYENLENSFNLKSTTIQITYKSPTKSTKTLVDDDDNVYEDVGRTPPPMSAADKNHKKKVLETTFDDKMVYEQVKFYRSAINEINDMLDEDNDDSIVPNNDDIPMTSDADCDIQDSLEFDPNNISMYENVLIKPSPKLYENIKLNNKITTSNTNNVKQLATKFELSEKNLNNINNNIHSSSNNKQLKITRSLDENAFIREFGKNKRASLENHKSIQQINIQTIDENELSRRKSLELMRPKSLNQPKKLPSDFMKPNNMNEVCKNKSNLKLEFLNNKNNIGMVNDDDDEDLNEVVKITPTTENRISLIQNNYDDKTTIGNCINNCPATANKLIENCKLDRERIEKIKEERRHQLNEKFNRDNHLTSSFKLKQQKLELLQSSDASSGPSDLLNTSTINNSISQRNLKSKLLQTNSSSAQSGGNGGGGGDDDCDLVSINSQRVRRFSDEKNQNNLCDSNTPTNNVLNSKMHLVGNSKSTINSVSGQQANAGKITANSKNPDVQEFLNRERDSINFIPNELNELVVECSNNSQPVKCSQTTKRDKISPHRSIKDVAAMFESRMQNQ